MDSLHLELCFAEKYQPVTDEAVTVATLELSSKQIREGLIRKLTVEGSNQGVRNFTVLIAIAAFMDSNHKAFPSQATLAEITGYSRTTVINAIKDLCQIEIGGQKILEKKKIPSTDGNSRTVYKFSAVEDSELIDFAEVEETTEKMTANSFIKLFCKYYEEQFGTKYMPVWGRDTKMVNQKLIGTFTDEELKDIARIAVTEYQSRWANRQYPYPSLGQICSWLANEANKVAMVEKKDQQKFEQRVTEAEKYSEIDSAAMLDL